MDKIFYRIFLISLLLSENLSAQTSIFGSVKNAYDLSPISFATFLCDDKLILMTNNFGEFSFEGEEKLKGKVIRIRCIGFKDFIIPFDSLSRKDSNFIMLQELTLELGDVIIVQPKSDKLKKQIWGSKSKKNFGHFYMSAGSCVALYFPNKKKKSGIIVSVGFFITDKGKPNTPFRVRILESDNKLESSKQLLQVNLVTLDTFNGNNWVDVNLEKYHIKIPKNGFYVAMEWLPESSQNTFSFSHRNQNKQEIETNYNGQVLGGTEEFKENLNYAVNPEGRLYKINRPSEIVFLNYLNPKIRATVRLNTRRQKN
jgi:hypothetical protein